MKLAFRNKTGVESAVLWHDESGAEMGGCYAPISRSGDCFARTARSAGTTGAKPLDAAAVSHAGSPDPVCGRWCGCSRERARTRVWPKTVRYWRRRWRQAADGQSVAERLTDAPRSGAPATYTPEQICAVIAMTCEKPSESERPIS